MRTCSLAITHARAHVRARTHAGHAQTDTHTRNRDRTGSVKPLNWQPCRTLTHAIGHSHTQSRQNRFDDRRRPAKRKRTRPRAHKRAKRWTKARIPCHAQAHAQSGAHAHARSARAKGADNDCRRRGLAAILTHRLTAMTGTSARASARSNAAVVTRQF